jgi:hypothetical protein
MPHNRPEYGDWNLHDTPLVPKGDEPKALALQCPECGALWTGVVGREPYPACGHPYGAFRQVVVAVAPEDADQRRSEHVDLKQTEQPRAEPAQSPVT